MKIFQLDECINSGMLADACNARGQCVAHRFPRRLKNHAVKDPDVLTEFFGAGKTIVTNDGEMLQTHVDDIPERHPGLIIVTHSPGFKREMTDAASAAILLEFKKQVPNWFEIPCDNSVVVLTEKSVRVLHKGGAALVTDLYAEYHAHADIARVEQALRANSER